MRTSREFGIFTTRVYFFKVDACSIKSKTDPTSNWLWLVHHCGCQVVPTVAVEPQRLCELIITPGFRNNLSCCCTNLPPLQFSLKQWEAKLLWTAGYHHDLKVFDYDLWALNSPYAQCLRWNTFQPPVPSPWNSGISTNERLMTRHRSAWSG